MQDVSRTLTAYLHLAANAQSFARVRPWSGILPILGILIAGEGKALAASCLDDFSLYSTDQTILRDRVLVQSGLTGTGGYLELGVDGSIQGVVAGSDILIRDRGVVQGDAVSGGTVTLGSNAQVTGNIEQGASVTPCPIPQIIVTHGSQAVNVWSGTEVNLSPGGDYGDVTVYSNARLNLSAGTYSFRTLQTFADAKIHLNTEEGPVEILVSSSLSFGDRTKFLFPGIPRPDRVKFYSGGDQNSTVYVGTDINYYGTLQAPFAKVKVFSRAAFRGAVYGRALDFEPDVQVHHLEADGDGDGVPDVVEQVTGHDPNDAGDKPQWAVPNQVIRDRGEDEVIEYDYSNIPGYEFRTRVPVAIEADLLENNLTPVVWVASPEDYGFSLPSLPPDFAVLGEVFNVSTEFNPPGTASVDSLEMGLPLPDDRPDWLSARFLKVYRYNGIFWEEMSIREITQDAVHFIAREFSPLVIAMRQTAPVVFVDSSVRVPPSLQDGITWHTAYATLAQALEDESNPDIEEIWVAKGTYFPSLIPGSASRTATFQMKEGVDIIGGFPPKGAQAKARLRPGWTDVRVNRLPEVYKTILSGDIGVRGDPFDNSYTVVKGAGSATLDGFVIEGGTGSSSPSAANEDRHGAGMDITDIAAIRVVNCVFRENQTTFDSGSEGGDGGGVWINVTLEPAPIFQNVRFYNNRATGRGGAIAGFSTAYNVEQGRFFSNQAEREGGALFNSNSALSVRASVFVLNTSGSEFDGMVSYSTSIGASEIFLDNCTITRQQPPKGTNPSITAAGLAFHVIRNSILWDNGVVGNLDEDGNPLSVITGQAVVDHSIVEVMEGVYPGEGNKNEDPLFALTESCFSVDCPFYLLPGSPAIDSGNGNFLETGYLDVMGNEPFDYLTTPNSGTGTPDYLDMGAFENQYDTDRDGLPDHVEIAGVPGAISNVPGDPFYANPFRKDVFVEFDYMEGTGDQACLPEPAVQPTQCLRPKEATLDTVSAVFTRAPVTNPDGSMGISLHFDISNGFPYDTTRFYSTGDSEIKGNPANWDPVREGIYHYAMHVFRKDRNAAGWGNICGDNFTVTSGNDDGVDAFWGLGTGLIIHARVVMHELGHNLCLHHGGWQTNDGKPNYLSIMNALFGREKSNRKPGQVIFPAWIPHVDGERLDFSRFYLENLDENDLDETAGLRVAGDGMQADLTGYGTRTFPDYETFPEAGSGVNWNRNNILETSVRVNLNEGLNSDNDSTDVFEGHWNDWHNLDLTSGGKINGGAQAAPLPFTFIRYSRTALPVMPQTVSCPGP